MLSNFNKAFKKNKSVNKVPKAILELLNDQLPKGFKYVNIEADICGLVPVEDEMRFTVNLPENEFNARTPEELMQYLYRTQKSIEVKSNVIKMNGIDFNIKDLIKRPFEEEFVDEENTKFMIVPPKFPQPFDLLVGTGDFNTILKFERQPYAHLNKSLFKSIDRPSLIISYIVDEKDMNMEINIKVQLDKAESVEEVILVLKLFNGFNKGKFVIGNSILEANECEFSGIDDIEDSIFFCEKVLSISKELRVFFKPKEIISKAELRLIEQMYASFIEKVEFKERVDYTEITMTFTNELEKNELQELRENNPIFYFKQYHQFRIFETDISLWGINSLSEYKINEIKLVEKDPFKYNLVLEKSADKGMNRTIRYFENEEEADAYLEK